MSKKISELTAASALTGTELVEVVQSGTNKRTTAQDIADLGSGTIDGSTGSTDNAILRADGTGGSTLQSSSASITDAGALSVVSTHNTITIDPSGQNIVGSKLSTSSDTLFAVQSANGVSGNVDGDDLFLSGGNGSTNGDGGDLYLTPGAGNGTGLKGNILINTFFGSLGDFGGASGVLYIANASSVPSSNPTDGGILFVESGALKFRGSSGTVTTIANA